MLWLCKAMLSRDEPSRLTAVHGFLLLLHTTASDPDGAASGGAGGSSTGRRRRGLELLPTRGTRLLPALAHSQLMRITVNAYNMT